MKCPLCEIELNTKHVIDQFSAYDLKKIYKKHLNVEILDNISNETTISKINCPNCDLVFFNPTFEGSEKFYENLSKHDWYYQSEKFEFDYTSDFVNKRKLSTLEIGAGRGYFAKRIDPSLRYVGLEFNDNAIKMAKISNVNIEKRSMAEFINSTNETFDTVVSFQVLEHISSPRSFLAEKIQLIKNNGFLIFAVPSLDSFYKNVTNHELNLPPHHLTQWSDKCLHEVSKIFNLELIEIKHEPLQPEHFRFYLAELIKLKVLGKTRTIRHDMKYKIISRISHFFAKILTPFFEKSLSSSKGAHVVAIYKKHSSKIS